MRDYKYYSTKTYGHEEGLSCMFRQPLATHSHCSLLHGYALSFSFKFGCNHLDDKNWVVDFGDLKDLKAWLKDSFIVSCTLSYISRYKLDIFLLNLVVPCPM